LKKDEIEEKVEERIFIVFFIDKCYYLYYNLCV